jgi:hypothetical protein
MALSTARAETCERRRRARLCPARRGCEVHLGEERANIHILVECDDLEHGAAARPRQHHTDPDLQQQPDQAAETRRPQP